MQGDIPPVYIVDPARAYEHFRTFKTRQEAVEFINNHGGMLVESAIGGFIVIRVPVKPGEVVETKVGK